MSSDASTLLTPSIPTAATSLAATAFVMASCGATATVSDGQPPSAQAQKARMCARVSTSCKATGLRAPCPR